MNIIKFKDVIRINDKVFNMHLKGKYAYFIHMRYVVPFEFISETEYVQMENDICCLINSDITYWDTTKGDILSYADEIGTSEANNINKFVCANKYVTDSDITEDEVKLFRTWLAKSLLEFDQNNNGLQMNKLYSESFTSVLLYYAYNMYDEVVKRLSEIHKITLPNTENPCMTTIILEPACGCGKSLTDVFDTNECNALNIYTTYVHDCMALQFGDYNFWTQFPVNFLAEFKMYIDNVIKLNLPLTSINTLEKFMDCNCFENTEQMRYMSMLENLSKSLQYIIEDEITGNKNFLTQSFNEWAIYLYEKMQWT